MIEEKSHVGVMICFYCNEPLGVAFDTRLRQPGYGPHGGAHAMEAH